MRLTKQLENCVRFTKQSKRNNMSGWGTQSDSAGWGPAPAANDAWGGGAAAATSGDSWGGAASNDHTMSGGANNWDGPAKDSAEKQTADFATG